MAKLQLLASFTLAVFLVITLSAIHIPAATAQSTPSFCNMTQEGLNSCKPAVSKSNPADPSAACCSALSGADLSCLCNFKNSNPKMMKYLGVDPDLALQLPAKCNIPTPAKC